MYNLVLSTFGSDRRLGCAGHLVGIVECYFVGVGGGRGPRKLYILLVLLILTGSQLASIKLLNMIEA